MRWTPGGSSDVEYRTESAVDDVSDDEECG
jgi:hypothetical protein